MLRFVPLFFLAAISVQAADPLLSSWLTQYSTKYARIYQTDTAKLAGTTVTTWTNGNQAQSSPAYCGVQEISYSSSWVYLRSTGLPSHIMGPWYNNAGRTQAFVNLPKNQKDLFRIPRTPTVPTTKTVVQGEIGFFVDGVHAFDSTDATSYSNASARDGDAPGSGGLTGDGIWNRDAYVNEGITFDPTYAHQQNTGVYHYHANPIGPRYLLGDHVDFDAVNKTYKESTTTVTKHSPIVGWAKDGFPIYGPYGYSSPTNASSGLRRMVPGYVPRNGSNGTTNVAQTGRTTLPAWAVRVQNRASTALTSTQYGPAVSTTFPLGRYIEDNDYLGDLGKTQGVDFDLDEYNGRTCVTPEYPSGTYAYFVAITASGDPQFPYNVGKRYYGSPTGGTVLTIAETVTQQFKGGPYTQEALTTPRVASGNVAVDWNSTEGATYKVEATNDLSTTWTTLTSSQTASPGTSTTYTEAGGASGRAKRFYRVTRTALATYDTAIGSGGITSVSPTNAARGTTFTLTINLDSTVNPPPQTSPVNSVTVGTISGTSIVHVSQTVVTCSITIPTGATAGLQNVNVVFPGPPGNATQTVTYSLTNGFTITAPTGAFTSTSASSTSTRNVKRTTLVR